MKVTGFALGGALGALGVMDGGCGFRTVRGECGVERGIRYFELICYDCNQTMCFSPLGDCSMNEARVCRCGTWAVYSFGERLQLVVRLAATSAVTTAVNTDSTSPSWLPLMVPLVEETVDRVRVKWAGQTIVDLDRTKLKEATETAEEAALCLRIAAAAAAAREPKRPEWFPTFKRWGRKTIRAVVNTVERFRSAWVAFWTGADREVMDAQRQAKVKA